MRAHTCRSLGRLPKGASVGLRMYTFKDGSRVDPWVIACGLAVHQWASLVWEGDPKPGILVKSLEAARKRCVASSRPWVGASSPAYAFYLMLDGIGWNPTVAQVLKTDVGSQSS